MSWTKQTSRDRVAKAIADFPNVEVVDLVRDTDLLNIPLGKAYRTHAVHAYVDIPNATALLGKDGQDGEQSHKKFLRFLHIFQRVARVALLATEAKKIDHQNERLHLVVYKPLSDERQRVAVAVAVAEILRGTIKSANELHDELADARVCIGIESGVALAVNNGTRGDREPLFVGNPANVAAKLLGSGSDAIFLGPAARQAMGAAWQVKDPKNTALTPDQIAECMKLAKLDITPAGLLKTWASELQNIPLADFVFSRPTPPLSDLDLDSLSPKNSRRLEAAVIMADIDGFTKFVAESLARGTAASAVRALHIIRKELRDVLNDFGGRKVRYVGDCVVGAVAEGTSRSTDLSDTVTTATRCAGALRDAFSVIQEALPDVAALGLSIGVELGPTSITRLGVQGERDRCIAGRAVLNARSMQERCRGTETGLGAEALKSAVQGIRDLFATGPIQAGLTYNAVMSALDNARGGGGKPPVPNIVIPRAHCQ